MSGFVLARVASTLPLSHQERETAIERASPTAAGRKSANKSCNRRPRSSPGTVRRVNSPLGKQRKEKQAEFLNSAQVCTLLSTLLAEPLVAAERPPDATQMAGRSVAASLQRARRLPVLVGQNSSCFQW